LQEPLRAVVFIPTPRVRARSPPPERVDAGTSLDGSPRLHYARLKLATPRIPRPRPPGGLLTLASGRAVRMRRNVWCSAIIAALLVMLAACAPAAPPGPASNPAASGAPNLTNWDEIEAAAKAEGVLVYTTTTGA